MAVALNAHALVIAVIVGILALLPDHLPASLSGPS
jgi:hypothetical protein